MNVMQKRFIIVFLVFVLAVGSYPGLIGTGGTVYAADGFAGGDGTPGNPFQIESSEQLNKVRDYLGSHFILNKDIDMSVFTADHPWEPIGSETTPFTGSLDGRNFKITNLVINTPSSDQPAGLFSVVGGTGSFIQNLTLHAVEVRGLDYVGILAGRNSTTIHNVGVTGSVYGQNFVGGLAGASKDSNISNSYATGIVRGTNDVGGLSGRMDDGVVSYSYAAVDVSSPVDVGGFIGKQENTTISYSYATGNVAGCEDVGGFVGDNGNSLISNSFATGTVTGSCESGFQGDSVGGLIGDNSDGDIENSYAIGRVTGDYLVGGLVGISGSGSVNSSFYNRDTTGQSGGSGQGLTSDEMKDRLNYPGWDFDTNWDMQAPHHDGYPYIKAIQAFVTYAGNGTDDGSEQISSQSYLPGSLVEIRDKSHDWTRAGYRFKGWNTAADGSGDTYSAHESIVLSSNILLYADWKQPAVPALMTPLNGEYTNNRSPVFSGTADGGATVVIILDGSEAATVMATDEGNWSWTPPDGLAEGLHTVRAGVVDSTGNPTSLSAEHGFTVDTVPPVIMLLGDASITLTAGASFADPGVTVTDAEEDIPVTITGSVNNQVPGTYTLQYAATDRAGNAAVPVTRTVRIVEGSSDWSGYETSDNANLAKLTVKADEDELALTPEFAAGTTHYEVKTTADEVTIEAIPSDAKAVITLNQANLVGEITVALDEGDNELEFKVRAESGALQTYSLTIHRLAKPVEPEAEAPVCTFRDIKGHWAESSICEAFKIGIVEGQSETMFQPEANITRAEFVAMLLRTLGINSGPAGSKLLFTDQDQIPAWATDVIGTAVENGLLMGYSDRTLRPMHRVSRAEMVVMMARAMKWEIEQGGTSFADDADIPYWAKGYVQGTVQRNLVHGREGNRFSPMDPATRAEATTLLLRLWHTQAGTK
ncbi:Listeria/Bacterioides repeat-containing protein [Paenibacillus sp. UNCCL117]|uniref:S-layer homology domain-containing protein n=1 Tax=unclassified Paenibacillus TaxID=185978 RepID=UPI00088F0FB5|nr:MULTISPECIES: S-layer homology domain-containing protein [unclassified Paenibacillus]SDD84558.1 Listeria/Bacterioides repeat-containing protein [Paenibacillus sp. cl123]SFW54582.1 Listeria/Bacterioides repeat-containing protein [Paenibacillus sp. UNCCL117]